MAPGSGNKKIANSLVALSSAAILAVYAAGFMKTRAAAARMDEASDARRPATLAPAAGKPDTPESVGRTAGVALATRPTAPQQPRAESSTTGPLTLTRPATATSLESPEESGSASLERPVTTLPETAADPVAAAASAPATTTAEAAPPPKIEEWPAAGLLMPKEKYKDGTYTGWGTSRHGDIQASVTIEHGRIIATSIAQCWTRYPCTWVNHLPGQVVARQSPDVDYVSGATQSVNAFYYAVLDALAKAK
jgi:uncharacterized protein with FMN-binding domain